MCTGSSAPRLGAVLQGHWGYQGCRKNGSRWSQTPGVMIIWDLTFLCLVCYSRRSWSNSNILSTWTTTISTCIGINSTQSRFVIFWAWEFFYFDNTEIHYQNIYCLIPLFLVGWLVKCQRQCAPSSDRFKSHSPMVSCFNHSYSWRLLSNLYLQPNTVIYSDTLKYVRFTHLYICLDRFSWTTRVDLTPSISYVSSVFGKIPSKKHLHITLSGVEQLGLISKNSFLNEIINIPVSPEAANDLRAFSLFRMLWWWFSIAPLCLGSFVEEAWVRIVTMMIIFHCNHHNFDDRAFDEHNFVNHND